jgi:hypothetical protein
MGRERRERERMGLKPFCKGHWATFMYFGPIYLVRNPLPVDVGTIGRTKSNMCVDCCVFSKKLTVKRFQFEPENLCHYSFQLRRSKFWWQRHARTQLQVSVPKNSQYSRHSKLSLLMELDPLHPFIYPLLLYDQGVNMHIPCRAEPNYFGSLKQNFKLRP